MQAPRSTVWHKGFHTRAPRLRLVECPAVEIDASLFRLSRHEARCRRLLGRLAAAFRKIEGHHRLGFARLGDYSKERLGLSGREIQSFASVALRLEELPSVARAFEYGELSWSQTRLLVAVAGVESEEEWLSRACGRTVRALVREIRRETLERAGPMATGSLPQTLDEENGSIEGEDSLRFRMRCPARIVCLWRRTVELARRMLGAQAPLWQAAEAIGAEGMSQAAPESAIALEEPVRPNGSAEEIEPASAREAFPRVDWSADGAVTADQESVDTAGLDAFDLDERMREVVRSMQAIDIRTGRLLRRLLDLRLHGLLGFGSFDRYVRERLGMSPSRARALVAIDRRSQNASGLSAAYEAGNLSWVRALTILPVVGGPHEQEWVVRAGEVTVRRLADEVEWALEMRDAGRGTLAPPEPSAPLVFPDLQMCARSGDEVADRKVTFLGPISVIGFFRAAVLGFSEPDEPAWRGLERLLRHVAGEWEAQPRHRDPIFERDGWRCAVPCCSSRKNLQDHHVRYRSRGGSNERNNRSSACAWHHLRGIHGGLVRASGRAPDDIVWELGLRSGRAPLLVLHGERYLQVFEN